MAFAALSGSYLPGYVQPSSAPHSTSLCVFGLAGRLVESRWRWLEPLSLSYTMALQKPLTYTTETTSMFYTVYGQNSNTWKRKISNFLQISAEIHQEAPKWFSHKNWQGNSDALSQEARKWSSVWHELMQISGCCFARECWHAYSDKWRGWQFIFPSQINLKTLCENKTSILRLVFYRFSKHTDKPKQ